MDFFQQFQSLLSRTPRNAVHSRQVVNSRFGDYIYRSKNAYLCYNCQNIEDCLYCEFTRLSRDLIDCSYVYNSELSYECIDCTNLYDCLYLQDCHHCTNCYYSYDLLNCQDCFGCVGLRQQRYAIFNKTYTEEIYRQKLAELFKKSPEKLLQNIQEAFSKHPRLSNRLLKGEEKCLGDYIYWSKNAYYCFNVRSVEDTGYLEDFEDTVSPTRDTYDSSFGSGLEECYECTNSSFLNNCNFIESSASCSDCEYCFECYACRNCFGCTYLTNKEYHILNKPFSREEYLAAIRLIKEELKQRGEYGKTIAELLI